jgi:hypothetical protein
MFKNMFCILALFGLATVLAIFQTVGRIFSNSSGHPVSQRFALSSKLATIL